MNLFFRKAGTGPPLLILHGLYGSSDNWISISKTLADHFTIYLPDLRNHGQSPHDPIHNYKCMAEDLYELVKREGLIEFFLAGHSMGGKVAILFASMWPEMIEGLMIADISPFKYESGHYESPAQHKTILETILSFDLSSLATRKEAELILSQKIDSEKIRGFILKNIERSSTGSFRWRLNAKALYDNLGAIMDGIARPGNNSIGISGFPVIFLKGSKSDYIPESDFKDIKLLFPGAEIRIVENAGHWLHVDRPDAVIDCLLEFLD
jgi:esterase